jgi:hypothetical protein
MSLYEYIKLCIEDKVEILQEEGEFLGRQGKAKEVYRLFSFYVISTVGEEEDIKSIYAINTEPENY